MLSSLITGYQASDFALSRIEYRFIPILNVLGHPGASQSSFFDPVSLRPRMTPCGVHVRDGYLQGRPVGQKQASELIPSHVEWAARSTRGFWGH